MEDPGGKREAKEKRESREDGKRNMAQNLLDNTIQIRGFQHRQLTLRLTKP